MHDKSGSVFRVNTGQQETRFNLCYIATNIHECYATTIGNPLHGEALASQTMFTVVNAHPL